MTSNIRFDAVCGLLSNDKGMSLCFNERGDSDGFDFTFLSPDAVEKKISLNYNEIQHLAIAAMAAGRLDLDTIKTGAEKLLGKPLYTAILPEPKITFSTSEPTATEKVFFNFTQLHNVLENTSFHLRSYIPDSTTKDLCIMPTHTNSDWQQLTMWIDGNGRKISLVFQVNKMVTVDIENIPDADILETDIINLFSTYFVKQTGGTFDSFCNLLAGLCLRYLHQ